MKEFIAVFQIDKTTIFEVEYYTLMTNNTPHFTTSANHFIRSKRDYDICGQAQDSLLKVGTAARRFYKKWDGWHLKQMTKEAYEEMRKDMELLKERYNFLELELSDEHKPYSPKFPFGILVEFSKQPLKKAVRNG